MTEEVFVKVGVSLRHRVRDLANTELRVLLALGLRINKERQCWPAISVLAEECRCSERQVQRAITSLLANNFIWIGRRAGGRSKFNIYTLNGYFAYGSEPVQILAPSMASAEEQKGDMGVGVSLKGDISEQKGDIAALIKGDIPPSCTDTEVEPLRRTNRRRVPSPLLTPSASLASFSDWLKHLEQVPNKVGPLIDAFKYLHPTAPVEDIGSQLGGRMAALYKVASKDYRRLLQAIWLAAAMPIVGSHLSYIQGMVRKEQHGQGPGLRAPGRDPEQGPPVRSVTEEDLDSGRAFFDEQLHRIVWADAEGGPG